MKQGYINVVFVIDESGSMGGSESDIIGGFNKTIEEQKHTEEEKERIKQDSIKRVKELEIENREKELANQQQQQI